MRPAQDWRSWHEYNFIPSDFSTVAVDIQHFNIAMRSEERQAKLLELVATLGSPTLIYCQAPASANRVAQLLIDNAGLSELEETREVAAWIAKHYHPLWNVAKAISLGIGIHHGGGLHTLSSSSLRDRSEKARRFRPR